MQISANNNYSIQSNQRQQQSPNFGKLIIDKSVSTELIKPIAKNSEIQKMVKIFHDVGIDIRAKVKKSTPICNPTDYSNPLVGNMLYFNTESAKVKILEKTPLRVLGFNIIKGADGTCVGFEHGKFLENIDKIKEGTAEEVFNEYQAELEIEKEGQRKDVEAKARIEAINAAIRAEKLQMKMDRENSLAIVEALNESLEPKKSFWKKLFNL